MLIINIKEGMYAELLRTNTLLHFTKKQQPYTAAVLF